jgi:hypothetical protein
VHARGSSRVTAVILPLLALGLGGCSGCGQEVKVLPLTAAEKKLSAIAVAYQDTMSQLDRPPKSADDLKPFLKRFGDPEDLLVSPNDSQPYVIVWGVDPTKGGPGEYQGMFPIIAYERQGAGGKLAVVDIRGRPLTIPAEDLTKLRFVGRHRPGAN